MSNKLKYFFIFILLIISTLSQAQIDTSDNYIYSVITLDSFVVTAKRQGFDVKDFIEMVRKDETFYQAFRNLRFADYDFSNDIKILDKKAKLKASYQSEARQSSDGSCRTMQVFKENVTGNFKEKKGELRYYTAKLYDRLFLTHGKVCENNIPVNAVSEEKMSGMEKYVAELKKLIFKPGHRADVPFIGKKMEIFEPQMAKRYDFSIVSRKHDQGHDCYVFTAKAKPEFFDKKNDETVVKFLETYFEKNSLQIVARNYILQYYGGLFQFDVSMEVQIAKKSDKYFPSLVRYTGMWDVPLSKPENAHFEMRCQNFIPK